MAEGWNFFYSTDGVLELAAGRLQFVIDLGMVGVVIGFFNLNCSCLQKLNGVDDVVTE